MFRFKKKRRKSKKIQTFFVKKILEIFYIQFPISISLQHSTPTNKNNSISWSSMLESTCLKFFDTFPIHLVTSSSSSKVRLYSFSHQPIHHHHNQQTCEPTIFSTFLFFIFPFNRLPFQQRALVQNDVQQTSKCVHILFSIDPEKYTPSFQRTEEIRRKSQK